MSQERSRSIIESSPVGMHLYQLQDDGRLVFIAANPAADQILRVDNSQFIGKTIEEAFPPLAETEVPDRYRRVCASGELWKTEQLTYEDDLISGAYEVHAFRTDGNSMVTMFSDITERRRAEEALRDHFEFERLISRVSARLISVPSDRLGSAMKVVLKDVCAFASADGGFVLEGEESSGFAVRSMWQNDRLGLNEKALSDLWSDAVPLLGTPAKNSDPLTLSSPAADDSDESLRYRLLIEQQIADLVCVPMVMGDELRGAVCLARAERGRGWTEDNLALVSLIGQILNSVVQRANAQDELRRAHDVLEDRVGERTAELQAANQELETFAYSISHDLRAPLRAVEGFSRVLITDIPDTIDPRAQDSINRIHAAARRMSAMIDGLLQLSRTAQATMQLNDVDLSVLARSIIDELESSEPERCVEFHVEPGLLVNGDERLLGLVLQNLIGNAWKFTANREDGRIDLLRCREGEDAYRPPRNSDRDVLCVRDNGVGFDMRYSETLFSPFGRLHDAKAFPGTGIGLATVQRVIHRHGGRVWAEAEPDRGAAFCFTVPRAASSKP